MGQEKWAGVAIGVGIVGVGLYLYFRGKPLTVAPSDTVGLKVVWRNAGKAVINVDFRCDLRAGGLWATWIEGEWLDVPPLEPGAQGEFDIQTHIPGDWKDTTVDIKLVARPLGLKESTVWSKNEVFKVGG